MSASESNPPAAAGNATRFWFVAGVFIVAAIAGSVFLNASLNRFAEQKRASLPVLGAPKMAFTATERAGTEKDLAELRGKAVVLAYTYTRCARGCAGVAAQMLKVRDAFAGDPRVHLVSVAAWPEVDTPAMLAAFAETIGVSADDPWWWLSTDRERTWSWMTQEAGFEPSSVIPEAERLNPEDVVAHDLRAVLIDPQGRLRGYYQLMHPQTEIAGVHLEKLEKDLRVVLAE